MNWLLCVCGLVVLLFALLGWKAGLIKTVFRLVSVVLALIIAAMISPVIAERFIANEDLMGKISDGVNETLNLDDWEEKSEISDAAIDELNLPEAIKKQLVKFNDSDGFAKLAVDSAAEYISTVVATIVIRAITYVIAFLIALFALLILMSALNLVAKMPGLSFLNRAGGLAVGIVQALVVIMVAFALITAASNTGWGQQCMTCINESKVLTMLYEYNIINGAFVDLTSFMR